MGNYNYKLYGAILGDIAGSIYEFSRIKPNDHFNIHDPEGHITDDALLTIALADAINKGADYTESIKWWAKEYDQDEDNKIGWGNNFSQWIYSDPGTVNDSWGNGCIMRVSPFFWKDDLKGAFDSLEGSHYHVKSFQAVASLWYMYHASTKIGGPLIYDDLESRFKFDVSALGTIDQLTHMFEVASDATNSLEEIIEYVVRKGGDCDTNASIFGELVNYRRSRATQSTLSQDSIEYVRSKLDKEQLEVLDKFNKID